MNNQNVVTNQTNTIPSNEEYFIKDMLFNEDDSVVILVKPRDYGLVLNE